MAIAQMQKISVIGLSREKVALVEELMRLGLVQINAQDTKLSDDKWNEIVKKDDAEKWVSKWDLELEKIDSALDILEKFSEKKKPASKPKIPKAVWRTLQAAVFVGSLLVIRSILFVVTTTKLYDKYYDPLSGETWSAQVIGDSTNSSIQAGIDCYYRDDYAGAIGHLIELPQGLFYLGLSQMGLERFDEARESLRAFQDAYPENPEVNWYLGLAYLRLDELDSAIISLDKLAATSNPYSSRAEELIGKIEKVKAAGK